MSRRETKSQKCRARKRFTNFFLCQWVSYRISTYSSTKIWSENVVVMPQRSTSFYDSRIALVANGAISSSGYRRSGSWLTPKSTVGPKTRVWDDFQKTGARPCYYLDYRFSATFLEWIRKVFPSLNQRNSVCSNQIILKLIDNRSTAYPNLPKLDVFSAEAPFSLKRSSFGRFG